MLKQVRHSRPRDDSTASPASYDWRACFVAVTFALALPIPTGLLATRIAGSALLLTAVVTVVGTGVSRWVYRRVANKSARPSCPSAPPA